VVKVEQQVQVHCRRFQVIQHCAFMHSRCSEKRFYFNNDGGVTSFVTAFFASNFLIHFFVLFEFFVDI